MDHRETYLLTSLSRKTYKNNNNLHLQVSEALQADLCAKRLQYIPVIFNLLFFTICNWYQNYVHSITVPLYTLHTPFPLLLLSVNSSNYSSLWQLSTRTRPSYSYCRQFPCCRLTPTVIHLTPTCSMQRIDSPNSHTMSIGYKLLLFVFAS